MEIIATISVPESYEKNSFTEVTSQLNFDINVFEACKTSSVHQIPLEDLRI